MCDVLTGPWTSQAKKVSGQEGVAKETGVVASNTETSYLSAVASRKYPPPTSEENYVMVFPQPIQINILHRSLPDQLEFLSVTRASHRGVTADAEYMAWTTGAMLYIQPNTKEEKYSFAACCS